MKAYGQTQQRNVCDSGQIIRTGLLYERALFMSN